jgi:ribosomal protein L27
MNNLIFNNLNGELVGGVSIKNLVETDREKYMGGSVDNIGNDFGNNGIGLSRFDNYVVPAGLYLSTQTGGKTTNFKKNNDDECISNELYEKIFGIVRYDMPALEKKQTKKNINKKEGKNKTKKQ